MLDVGFSELLLILAAGVILLRPKDYPAIIRRGSKLLHELRGATQTVRKQVQDVIDEAGLEDIEKPLRSIVDLDGKPQVAYDVAELSALERKKDEA